METIVIVSTLFFNKKGNQSLLETIKYYSKRYNVVLITCASKKDNYYYNDKEIGKLIENNIKIVRVYQIIPNILRRIKRLKINKKKSNTNVVSATNLSYSTLNKISFKIASIFLYKALKKIVTKDVSIICAYEIGAVSAVLKYKNTHKNKIKYLAKFQGTVLGFDVSKLGTQEHINMYSLDYKAFRRAKEFDLCAITNDGTNGKQVLKYFGVLESKIICLPNGVSEHVRNIAKNVNFEVPKPVSGTKIHLFCLSRLVSWKRVWLSIEIMNYLVNYLKCDIYDLNIYGFGTETENKELEELINKYNLKDYVKIHGPVEYSRIIDVFNYNHIMLSLYSFTNVTNPVLEAIYLGIPVITLYDNDINEIVIQTNTRKVTLIKEISIEQVIKEISNFLRDTIFSYNDDDDKVDTSILNWDTRLTRELELLKNSN